MLVDLKNIFNVIRRDAIGRAALHGIFNMIKGREDFHT